MTTFSEWLSQWLSKMTPGELLGWVTGISTVVIGIWSQLGKRGETVFSRIEAERKLVTEERERLTVKLQECEKEQEQAEERERKLKAENDFLSAGHRAFIEFLEDVQGGSYGFDWVKSRAEQLLKRYKV